jgi:hypothetical protein
MKKFTVFAVCAALLCSFAYIGQAESVAGLQEKMDALWLKNNVSQAEIDEMNQQYEAQLYEQFWNANGLGPSEWYWIQQSGKYRTESHTAEDEYQAYLGRSDKPDYDSAILTTRLNTSRYALQYANADSFDYLFSDQQYWAVGLPKTNYGVLMFTEDCSIALSEDGIPISQEAFTFLKNVTQAGELLAEKGERNVVDVKIFSLSHMMSFLYLKCENTEYVVKLYAHSGSEILLPQIEPFKLYLVSEMIQAVTEKEIGWIRLQQYAQKVVEVKPTYETEGEALMQEGLIQGTEKGYDPLKPLNRIEATTILVRALGLENEQVSETPEFSDVEAGSWGVKYANIAKAQGLSNGVGDNKFAPDDLVTDNQFATLLLRAVDEPEFDWQTAIQILIERGIITAEQAETMDLFTRGDMAKIIYEAKQKGLIG